MFCNLFTEEGGSTCWKLRLLNFEAIELSFESKNDLIASNQRSINRHLIEWHRKFTLSFACIILFFIGAPLGAIIRKGGIGIACCDLSAVFFSFSTSPPFPLRNSPSKERSSLRSACGLHPQFLLPIGLFLTYKSLDR